MKSEDLSPLRFLIIILVCNSVTAQNGSNVFAPVLAPGPYSRTIPETWPYGHTIIDINATDNDAAVPNNVFGFEIQEGNVSDGSLNCFNINLTFGFIFAKASLRNPPCYARDQYQFGVRARDKGSPSRASTVAPVTITIIRNSNRPRWDSSRYEFNIDMNQTINSLVGTIRATDLDPLDPFGQMSYSVIGGGNGNSFFSIQQRDNENVNVLMTSLVLASNVLEYKLFVLVQDNGLPRHLDITEVVINVRRNLNLPYFTTFTYNFQTFEDVPPAQIIGTPLQGRDDDLTAPWNEVYYRLNTTHHYFTVNRGGQVSVYRDLRHDVRRSYSYTLSAQIYDGGSPSLNGTRQATINIIVFRNRDCPFFWSLPTVTEIQQNQTGNIFTVTAGDVDISPRYNTVYVSVVNDNGISSYFGFDHKTGNVNILPPVATSNVTQYLMKFQAHDYSCHIQAVLTINVVHNLSPPRWTQASDSITVLETQPAGLVIYRLGPIASDPDVGFGSNFRFSFATGTPNANLLFFDSDGNVFLRTSLLGRTDDPYNVQFILVDEGNLSSGIFTLTVNVIRNQPPSVTITGTSIEIPSKQQLNVEIERCTGSDPDTRDPINRITYSLIGDLPANNFFSVDPQTCSITVSQSLETTPVSLFILRIEVRDGGTPQLTDSTSLAVRVNRNLNSPDFTRNLYTETILEIKPVGETILTVRADDRDNFAPNNEVQYSLLNPDLLIDQYFGINPNTGAVFSKIWQVNFVDRNRITFTFDVTAEDKGLPPRPAARSATVTITVIRNTAPKFINPNLYQTQIQATQAAGSVIFTVTARDYDRVRPFNETTFSVEGDGSAPAFFDINHIGVITLKHNADLQGTVENQFTIRMRLTDSGMPRLMDEAFVVVRILRNFDPPALADVAVPIPYNSFRGRLVTDLTATDGDSPNRPEGQVRYEITSGEVLNGITYFFLNPVTGVLTLSDTTDLQSIDRFIMTVRAYDLGTPSLDTNATVTVSILKQKDALAIPNYNFTIDENVNLGLSVGLVVATPPQRIQYRLLRDRNGRDGLSFFYIEPDTGEIYLRQPLTGATDNSYTLVIQATDNGNPQNSAEAYVTININPIQLPTWSATRYGISIEENRNIGQIVFRLSATKPGATIHYRAVGDGIAMYLFAVNETAGRVTVRNSLRDFRDLEYRLMVHAYDVSLPDFPSETVLLITMKRNVNAPGFSQNLYLATVTDNTPVYSDLVVVNASDPIDGDRVTLRLVGPPFCQNSFQLLSTTGQFFLKVQPNTLGSGQINCNIEATDDGYPKQQQSTAIVKVIINLEGNFTESNISGHKFPCGADNSTYFACKTPFICVYEQLNPTKPQRCLCAPHLYRTDNNTCYSVRCTDFPFNPYNYSPVDRLNVTVMSIRRETKEVVFSWRDNNPDRHDAMYAIQVHSESEVKATRSGGTVADLSPGNQYNFSIITKLPPDDYYPLFSVTREIKSIWTKPAVPGKVEKPVVIFNKSLDSGFPYKISFERSEGVVVLYEITVHGSNTSETVTCQPGLLEMQLFTVGPGQLYNYSLKSFNGNFPPDESQSRVGVIRTMAREILYFTANGSQTVELSSGSDVSFECALYGISPLTGILSGGNMSRIGQQRTDGHLLQFTLRNVECEDSGQYMCSSVNSQQPALVEDRAFVTVNIICPISVIDTPNRTVVQPSGYDTEVTIQVFGYPRPTNYVLKVWVEVTLVVVSQDKYTVTFTPLTPPFAEITLVIKNGGSREMTQYELSITNTESTTTVIINVINEDPEPEDDEPDTLIYVGIGLGCSALLLIAGVIVIYCIVKRRQIVKENNSRNAPDNYDGLTSLRSEGGEYTVTRADRSHVSIESQPALPSRHCRRSESTHDGNQYAYPQSDVSYVEPVEPPDYSDQNDQLEEGQMEPSSQTATANRNDNPNGNYVTPTEPCYHDNGELEGVSQAIAGHAGELNDQSDRNYVTPLEPPYLDGPGVQSDNAVIELNYMVPFHLSEI